MADIKFNVGELMCKTPIITDAHHVFGTEVVYSVSWTSDGDYLDTVASPVTVELYYSIDGAAYQAYSGNPVPYNQNNVEISMSPQPFEYVNFFIRLTSSYCSAESLVVTAYSTL